MQTSPISEHKKFSVAEKAETLILEGFGGFTNEVDILKYSQQIKVRDSEIFLRTFKTGDFDLPSVVLLHGFGGSSLAYFKILKELSTRFKVFAFDWPGMGLSDRLDFKFTKNPEDIISFFVEVIESWRKAVGLTTFTLIGHSFGGYIAANYYLQYPELVNELFLLGPMMSTKAEEKKKSEFDAKDSKFFQQNENLGILKSIAWSFMKFAGENRCTPQTMMAKWYIPSSIVINNAVNNTFQNGDKLLIQGFKDYFEAIYSLPHCDDTYIHDLISYPTMQAQNGYSLEELFSGERYAKVQPKRPIHSLFGDKDFMDSDGCHNLYNNYYWYGTLRYLENSGHNMMMDASKQLLDIIFHPKKRNEQDTSQTIKMEEK